MLIYVFYEMIERLRFLKFCVSHSFHFVVSPLKSPLWFYARIFVLSDHEWSAEISGSRRTGVVSVQYSSHLSAETISFSFDKMSEAAYGNGQGIARVYTQYST